LRIRFGEGKLMFRLGHFVLLVGLFGFGAQAMMDLPPELKTAGDLQAWKVKVLGLVPEISTSTSQPVKSILDQIIEKEQNLVKTLRADPRYMAEAESRPPLQTFKILRGNLDQIRGRVTGPLWVKELTAAGFAKVLPQHQPYFRKAILDGLDLAQKKFTAKIFAGLSRLLEPEERAILSEPNPERKWSEIAIRLNRKDIQWIRENFDASLFGITSPEWQLSDLDALITECVTRERNLAMNIERLYARGDRTWFIEDDLLVELKELVKSDPKKIKFLREFKQDLAKRFGVFDGVVKPALANRELILRELPPYVAIYRGCVGSDCSTTHSYAYPYSPFERNWWIENPQGRHLGYVSGNITLVEGKQTLYIRDVTGPGLITDDIPMILNGFYLAKQNFGTEQMTLADAGFAAQNHFQPQQAELMGYTGLDSKVVHQQFQDLWVRNILSTSGGNTSTYDSTEGHMAARRIDRTSEELEGFRIEMIEGNPVTEVSMRSSPDRIWSAVSTAVQANSTELLVPLFENEKVDLNAFLSRLRNEEGKTVKDFLQDVEQTFLDHKLPYSRNLAKKFESLFQLGYLKSSDAFSNEESIRQSVRYVMDLLWRSGTPEEALPYLRENLEIFQNNEIMRRGVQALFDRWTPEDVRKIQYLDTINYSFEEFVLNWSQSMKLSRITYGMNRIWAIEKLFAFATEDELMFQVICRVAEAINDSSRRHTWSQRSVLEKAMRLLDSQGNFVGRNPTWAWNPILSSLESLMIQPNLAPGPVIIDAINIYLRNGGGQYSPWAKNYLLRKLPHSENFRNEVQQSESRGYVEGSCETTLAG
jgi:hypothetical protein